MTSLEGWDSAIELRPQSAPRLTERPIPLGHADRRRPLVGEAGFEPATSCSQSRCAAGLRYSPFFFGPDLGRPLFRPG